MHHENWKGCCRCIVSCGQTASFSLSLGRENKGLVQFESHNHLDTSPNYVTSMQLYALKFRYNIKKFSILASKQMIFD